MAKTTADIATTEPGTDAGEDRLSYLPEEVISHILSFMETKYAVGTAVLSRRWKDHWARVSNLDIDNGLVYKTISLRSLPPSEQLKYQGGKVPDPDPLSEILATRDFEFCRFVDKVLGQHTNLDSLRRFRFHFSNFRKQKVVSDTRVKSKRELVFGPLVAEIDVRILGQTEFAIPQGLRCIPGSFYTLKSLKVAKLVGVVMGAVNQSFSLPSLKILQLTLVEFADYESLGKFISGCLALETLLLENCHPSNRSDNDVIDACLPSLKNLKICENAVNGDDELLYMCRIVIDAPKLEDLCIVQSTLLEFKGSTSLPCLHSVSFDFDLADFASEASYRDLIRLFRQISSAKIMSLSQGIMYHLSSCDDVELLVFPSLTHLTIGPGGSSWFLHSLLNSASKLQSFVINLEGHTGLPIEWESLEAARTPECLLSSLEEIDIRGIVEFENDWKMIVYLLSAGAALKNVNMHVKSCEREVLGCRDLATLIRQSRGPRHWEACLLLPNNKVILIDDEAHFDDDDDDEFDDDTDDDDKTYKKKMYLRRFGLRWRPRAWWRAGRRG